MYSSLLKFMYIGIVWKYAKNWEKYDMMPGGHQDKVMKTGHLGISGALATDFKLGEITTCNVEKGIYIELPIKNYYLTL